MKIRKYNKLLVGLVLVMALAAFFTTVNGVAIAESIFYFTNGEILGFASAQTENIVVEIPAEINGSPVTTLNQTNGVAIGFNQAPTSEYIVGVDLSNATNLTEIGVGVFSDCVNLKEVILNPQLVDIQRQAFSGTTALERVVVLHTNDTLNVRSSSFEEGTKFVFQSESIMNSYLAKNESVWSKHSLTYMYDLKLDMGGEIETIASVEKGSKLGELYSEILSNYFNGYTDVVINQSSTPINENTILDGTTLTFVSAETNEPEIENSEQNISITYGEDYILQPNIQGAYVWTSKGDTISTNSSLSLELNVGDYEYVCTITTADAIKVITYNITVNAAKYDFSWPIVSRYEYYDVNETLFLNNTQKNDLNIEFYKDTGSGYEHVNAFSIGDFKAVVEPKSSNYYVEDNTFEFTIDYSYLTLAWEGSEFQYSGNTITPQIYLVGDTRNHDVNIVATGDLSAINVGDYTIVVTGLSDEYYKLTNATVTTYNWSIKTTTLTVEWSNNSFDYTTSGYAPVARGVYGGISIPLVVKSANNVPFDNAGTYDLIVEIPSEYSGFVLSGELTGTMTINPIKINAAFNCLDEYTYTGEYFEITAEITSNIEDDVELVLEGNYFKDAGNYTAVITGTTNPNYYVNKGISLNWSILPKPVVVKWNTVGMRYTGDVLKPSATIDTGIAGEQVSLVVIADNNINANEGSSGYVAKATLPEGNSNYLLIDDTTTYFINRAIPSLDVDELQEVVYNGKNLLPTYEFVGDEGNLKIYINGVETSGGVKEAGTYEILFKSPKSANYNELIGEHSCWFIIKAVTIENSVGDTKVVLTNENVGFYNTVLSVKELNHYPMEIVGGIENSDDYNVEKVLEIGNNDDFSDTTTITLSLDKVNAKKVKIFVLQDNKLVEKECLVEGKEISFVGGVGTYFILVEKPAWIASSAGILTITLSFVVILAAIFAFIVLRSKQQTGEKLIATLVETRLKEKISKGEEITTEDTLKIREQVVQELKNKKKDNK